MQSSHAELPNKGGTLPHLTSDSDITTLLVCERSRTGSVLIAKKVLKSCLKYEPLWKRAVSTALSNVFKIFYYCSWSSSHLFLLGARGLYCSCWSPRTSWDVVFIVPFYTATGAVSVSLFQTTVFLQELTENAPFFSIPFSVGSFMTKWPFLQCCSILMSSGNQSLGPCAAFPHIVLWKHNMSILFSFHNRKQLLNHFIHCH